MTANTTTTIANIPEIILLCHDADFITAFQTARNSTGPIIFDLIVSPANSYGRLDGGFYDAISLAFSPRDDYEALTRSAAGAIREMARIRAPPSPPAGTCTLVQFPILLEQNSRRCAWVAVCSTMWEPMNVVWDREAVYESV
ncbi:hypothetical protein LV164_007214 [Aspergillus fumigatus]|nr:hypothetical protein KXX11_002832 [Aspergillus fumigatus]KAH1315390.1 hypothetical protein KXX38_002731 [Aspergillus fumigatus]KAH1347507.1 hypothetical protein KXX14_004006 [Aspergillus fumigatus]KAH1373748.1 hypothetical protein KXX50_002457 [Aspergillus fumigatus]KAH1378658.1 hypothetical protein KXX49_007068 [Aspergillus fumigatus]